MTFKSKTKWFVTMFSAGWHVLPVSAQSGPQTWVAPSLQRVGQTDGPGSTAAQLKAGRGEYESFQVVVRAPAGGLSNVNVTVSDLTGPNGSVIPKTSFTLYREQYVLVSPSSPNFGGSNQPGSAGMYADGLIPFTNPATGQPLAGASLTAVPFNLPAGGNQPMWVDVSVPRSAMPGQYSGTYTVSSDQGNAAGSVSLTVWSFTLPVTPSLKSAFLYWTADSLPAVEELLKHRIAPLKSNNQLMLMSNYGLSSTGLPFYSGADVSTCSMSPAPSAAQFQQAAASQAPGLFLYDYSADEIDNCPNLYPTIRQWAYNMHQAGVKNLITMSPIPALYDDGSGTGRSAVDIWTMLPIMYDGAQPAVKYVQQKGDAAWSYNALVQDSYSPKWLIDFAPINFRIQPGFISQSLGLTGLLYWRIDRWSSDPWNQVNNTGTFSSANYPGEGMFVYPGQQVGIDGVAPSMRLKWLRDGSDDYEYVEMLKAKGQGAWALQLAQTVGLNWSTWTRDPNALQSVRDQLGARLDQLYGGSTTPPPGNGSCVISLGAATQSVAASGGSVTVGVTAPGGCNWTAVSNVSWITIAAVTNGTGNGSVLYSVASNMTGSDRTGSLNIGGLTLLVSQPAGLGFNSDSFVRQLYVDLLGRQPDPGGLAYWDNLLASGAATRRDVAVSFFDSPECKGSGSLVIAAYIAILGRDPDFAGWSVWLSALQNGTPQKTIIQQFIISPEFVSTYGNLSNAALVQFAYQNVLGRTVDPAGFAFWLAQLTAGLPRGDLLYSFIASAEFQAKIQNRSLVDLLYLGFLRRNPDPTGEAYWLSALNNGLQEANAIDMFINSAEYIARF